MKLLIEEIQDFEVLTESENGKKYHYIVGPFMQAETANRNGRMYPMPVMEKAVNNFVKEFVEKNRAVGTLGHEDSPKVSETKVSHLITSLKFDGNDVIGRAKVLETSSGKELAALIEGGVSFGCSSRALGSLKEGQNGVKIVQDDFVIATVDAVLQPSGISCWTNAVYENADWIFVEGKGWVEQFREEARKTISKTTQKDIDRVALQIFENYMNKLKNQ
jgi:Prohead core protein serine protease